MYGGGYRSLEVFEEKLRNNLLKQICDNPISVHTVPFTREERISADVDIRLQQNMAKHEMMLH